jgi:two-component system cell cycle sensor histidine kinase/response regulator CckA
MNRDETIEVLLIDDDVDDYILTRELFSLVKDGTYSLDWVSTYEEGLTAVARGKHQVCLVDYNLGARTGVELIREARQIRLSTPMILLTGQADHDTDVAAMEAGATDFLVKDETSPARLERTIRYAVRLNAERARTERELAAFGQRQAVLAELGRLALAGGDITQIFTEAVTLVRQVLQVDHCKILELLPDGEKLVLRAGVGWQPDCPVDVTTVSAGTDSQAGFTLLSDEPVIVEDMDRETRFAGSPLLKNHGVVSGMTVVIGGRNQRYGVLGAHTHTPRVFTSEDVDFLRVVANVLGEAIERNSAEGEIVELNARRNLIFDSNMIGILSFKLSGQITEANGAFLKMVGYTQDDVVSGRLRWPEMTPPEYFSLDQNALAELASTGVSHLYEKEFFRKDGSRVPILLAGAGFAGNSDSGVAFIVDITERTLAEKSLRQSESQFRSLFEKSLDGVMIADDKGVCTDSNPAVSELLGLSYNEVIGRSIGDMSESESRAETLRMWDEFQRDGKMRGLFRLQRSDQEVAQVEYSAIANFLPGRHLLMLRDITEHRVLEDKLRQSAKLEAVGLLAGGIAHDFNNLLTVITGYSELALRSLGQSHPLLTSVEEILKASERAAVLTRQLLAFSRKQILQPKIIDLNPVILNLEKMLTRLVGEDLEVVILPANDLGYVKADPGQMEQVIVNLVVNARDAMPTGGKITLATCNVYIDQSVHEHATEAKKGEYVMLSATDTGTGMEAANKKHLFEPFFTTKEFGKGTGLGLSTVYGIVKQSGGHIEVFSEVGMGTSFKIYLPRVAAEAAEEVPQKAPSTVVAAGTQTILVVEDDEMVRTLARACLESSDYEVLDAASGPDAILICEQHSGPIHLLLTDVVMPQMSGGELAVHFARLRPGIPVLFMSGYTDKTIVDRGILNDSVEFIAKPFKPNALALKVAQVLQRK